MPVALRRRLKYRHIFLIYDKRHFLRANLEILGCADMEKTLTDCLLATSLLTVLKEMFFRGIRLLAEDGLFCLEDSHRPHVYSDLKRNKDEF